MLTANGAGHNNMPRSVCDKNVCAFLDYVQDEQSR
jgi:hypothetical protein